MPAVWQHGDFSLNNLMVSPDSMAVIDFEEFGLTRMPLHDAFGLAFSFQHSQNDQCPIPLKDCLEQCIAAPASLGRFDDADGSRVAAAPSAVADQPEPRPSDAGRACVNG